MHSEIKRVIKQAVEEFGYERLPGLDGRTHYRLRHRETGYDVRVPCSPSDWRWKQNLLSDIRRGARSERRPIYRNC